MSLQSGGLTDIGFGAGFTENFQVQYDSALYDTLPPAQQATVQANLIANANYLLSVVEGSFTTTIAWFGTPASKFGTGNRQQIFLNKGDGGGANNSGYGNPINVDGQGNNSTIGTAGPIVAMVWMNEWAEVLMSIADVWNRGDSSGEGLSQYSGITLFQAGHYDYYGSWVDTWLNGQAGGVNPARSDWVTQTFEGSGSVHGDGDAVSFGCALAFIYYLNVQLNFSINQIIATYSNDLAACYNSLTGDNGDPFPTFLNLISGVYPASQTANIPGPVSDNPFPIAQVSFWGQKDTFGKDESQDIINTQGGLVSPAFSLAIEGFSKNSFLALNIQPGAFAGSFATLPGVTISVDPGGAQFESGIGDNAPQRILIPFDITLSSGILGQFPATGETSYTLTVSLTSNGNAVSGSQAATQFELIAGADPYFNNLNSGETNLPYLSQDLRVFTGTPGLNATPIPGGPTLTDSVGGAYAYIQKLLQHLNSPGTTGFTNPNGPDPFANFPDQGDANQGDSSVTPISINPNNIFDFLNNYNFAVARVRLRGSSGMTGEAANVRVFFRLFATQSNDTDYDPTTTYLSSADMAGLPGEPKVGSGNTTIPFFATNNFSSQTDYVMGGPNIQTMVIPDHEDSLWWYFGCFLNLYDSNNTINGSQVQTYLAGTHHCLVAQIAFDDAPIPAGVSPLAWDQLAQRNLQVTLSDNPGPAATHRIPQTFDCRPSKSNGSATTSPKIYPDELAIEWGKVPSGAIASLYWPQVASADVIALADEFYAVNPLTAADSHTIRIPVTRERVSYVPIPAQAGENFAGLFTIDLPSTVRSGQSYDVTIRRISTKSATPPPPPPPPPQIQTPIKTQSLPATLPADAKQKAASPPMSKKKTAAAGATAAIVIKPTPIVWRYVVGTFQVHIPVMTGDKILPSEETTLAIMKWRLEQMAPSNRWYPVLERYISYISARVAGLGGNPNTIPPSLTGVLPVVPGQQKESEYSGKVCEVLFDCHGDFEGFALEDCCCKTRFFRSRAGNVGELALRACHEGLTVSVFVGAECDRIRRLVVRA